MRGHHERWDGRGYPDRLGGEAIPEGARILTLADAWDVMTSARPYGAPLSREDALAECRRCSGAQFWPVAVEALERAIAEGHLPSGAEARRDPTRGGTMDLKGNAVTWLGHGTWLWETSEGKRLLIDAVARGQPRHARTSARTRDAVNLDGILITHGHFDHIGQGGAEADRRPSRERGAHVRPRSRSPSTSAARASR